MSRDKEAIYQELLALRCRRGDKAALEELVRHWEKRLYFFLRQLVKEEQETWDLLQQTWLKVLHGIHALKDPQRLAPWLYTIARNTALNHGRNAAHYQTSLNGQGESEPVQEDSAGISFENAEQVHAALSRLSVPHREVVTLFFLEDLSIEEIASILGLQPGTVKSRLHYAKRALRKMLEEAAS